MIDRFSVRFACFCDWRNPIYGLSIYIIQLWTRLIWYSVINRYQGMLILITINFLNSITHVIMGRSYWHSVTRVLKWPLHQLIHIPWQDNEILKDGNNLVTLLFTGWTMVTRQGLREGYNVQGEIMLLVPFSDPVYDTAHVGRLIMLCWRCEFLLGEIITITTQLSRGREHWW